MKLSRKNIYPKVYEYFVIALAFSIPVHSRLVALLIALMGLFWILEMNFAEKYRRIKNSRTNKLIFSFSILFFIYLISGFYSENMHGTFGALNKLEVKLSLLVFPLFFSTVDFTQFNVNWIRKVRNAFISGCMLVSIFMINLAVTRYFKNSDPSSFFYIKFADYQHPSYLAQYMAFANLIVLYEGIQNLFRKPLFRTLFLILFFQVIIVLLSSKAGILGLIASYGVFLIYVIFFKKLRAAKSLIIIGLIIASFFVTLFLSPSTLSRFNEMEQSTVLKPDENIEKNNGSSVRLTAWKTSLTLIKQKPLFGYGVGDVHQQLVDKYSELGLDYMMEMKIDPHNQYLQMMLAAGIPGVLILLSSFLLPGYFAFRKTKILYLVFILLFMIHSMVESMLERQGGVVYYAFFNLYLFYISFVSKNSLNTNKSDLSQSVEV